MINRRLMFFLFTIVFLGVVAGFIKWVFPHPKPITSFEDCAKAGYPVMESYPRQCTTPGGKFFVENIIKER